MSLLQGLEAQQLYDEFTVKGVLLGMLRALEAIHSVHVVHRDIKPDNFLCSGGLHTIKLCDFGLAESVAASGHQVVMRDIYGTAPFMSPEMLSCNGYDISTDMWSFAVIAYVMMLGSFPYQALDK